MSLELKIQIQNYLHKNVGHIMATLEKKRYESTAVEIPCWIVSWCKKEEM